MKLERRIDPDVDLGSEELMDGIERLIARSVASRVSVVNNEGVRGWIVGIGTTLITAFIVGAWVLSNQVASLQTEVNNLKGEVAELKKLVEPRLRGG